MDYDELLNIAVSIGHLLIESGAEISRAEESVLRVVRAYGCETGEVFALPSVIHVSLTTPSGHPITRVRRVMFRRVNLDRVERTNGLCRRISRDRPDLRYVRGEISAIRTGVPFSFWLQTAACALVAFSFTLFYGGNLSDALVSLFCGALIQPFCAALDHLRVNRFFTNISVSFFVAAIALMCADYDFSLNYDKIIIGALMNLVPGIAITDFMRDIIAGDVMAGLVRFTESMLTATAIAIGAGIALSGSRLFLGV